MKIEKWHVYLADLNPRFGTEPGKVRPILVIQTNLLNEIGHPSTLICPLTTKVLPQAKWLRVHLRKNESDLNEKSDVLVDQIRAIDNRRFQKKLGMIRRDSRIQLRKALKVVLDL